MLWYITNLLLTFSYYIVAIINPGQSTADKSKAASQDPTSIVLGVLVGILLIAVLVLLATSIMLR